MSYKDSEKVSIGSSDIAKLVYVGGDEQMGFIRFIEDGDYSAYIIDDKTEIPAYYSLVASGKSWLKIYDDEGLARSFPCGDWKIYRAGAFGCIIRITPESEEV